MTTHALTDQSRSLYNYAKLGSDWSIIFLSHVNNCTSPLSQMKHYTLHLYYMHYVGYSTMCMNFTRVV